MQDREVVVRDTHRVAAHPLFVLVHSPLVGPYSWALVADALRRRDNVVVIPEVRSLEHEGPPYWQRHVEAISQTIRSKQPEEVVLVGHSGAGRLLPVAGHDGSFNVAAYVFVDSDIPTRTESRFDAMPDEVSQQFRDSAEGGMLLPWPEEIFEQEIADARIRKRLLSEVSPLPLAVYEEAVPLPSDWPDAKCAYIRTSDRYPEAEAIAGARNWEIHRFDGNHFHILVAPQEVASVLIQIAAR